MEGICGPGEPTGSPARGVTPTEIQVGVLNDATSTLSPGLGAIYLVVAEAFTEWCNAAGGINGRRITFVSRDAGITQAAARVTDACQSDFMLVGGATPFDANTVAPRLDCDLGAIPAYAASPEAITSDLQALPTRVAFEQANIGVLRLLEGTYGDAFDRIGMLAIDTPSLLQPAEAAAKAIGNAGYDVVSFQKLPLTADSWRTYVQPLQGKADAVLPAPVDPTGFFRAMRDVGYQPEVLLNLSGSAYGPQLIDSLEAAPVDAPYYVGTTLYPLELADENPAVKLALDLTEATGTDLPVDPGANAVWASWLLFAQSATACGNDLTMACVIDGATRQTDYTAGGLLSPVDLSDPTAIPACIAVLSADADGFHYERELTQPTDDVFNCDPANVAEVEN